MDWSVVPIMIAAIIGLVGFALMTAAFALAAKTGGFINAMKPTPDGRWPLAHRLMLIGALLGVVFGVFILVLFMIPGGIPWRS